MKQNNNYKTLKSEQVSMTKSELLGSADISFANTSERTVTSGTATISPSGDTINITQSTSTAIINWQNFSINNNQTVNFVQPSTSSITLIRVRGNEKSIIDGALNANGQVWILNSNGVLFNKNTSVNISGLLSTTKELSDTDFVNGNYNFTGDSTQSVINIGTIKVENSGSVILGANEVQNEGTIKAIKGKVHLTGTDEYLVNLNENSLVNLSVSKGVLDAMVKNSGTIIAHGGEVYLTTNAVNELLKGVVNNAGIIEANSIDDVLGKVELFAHGGEVELAGSIEAMDGFVETSGKDFTIQNDTNINAKTWLTDPTNLIVSNASSYEKALENGTDTIIQTDNTTGTGEGNIYINVPINWTTTAKLTINAYNDIYK